MTELTKMHSAASCRSLADEFCSDDFEIVSCIGIGAFGRVVLCRHTRLNLPFALKQIARVRRAKRSRKDEIEIMQQLRHPAIAHIEGRFECNGKMYLVLPYYQGGDLLSRLIDCTKMSMKESKFYLASVHLALSHIHRLGIMYRDLKLENIMLSKNGSVKLIDFGLAKRVTNANQRSYTICGTVEYMSPEMLMSSGYTSCNDLWALGVLFHEFVTGKPPFGDRRSATYQDVYEEIIYYYTRRKQMELDDTHRVHSQTTRRLVSYFLPYFNMSNDDDIAADLLLQLLSPIATMRPKNAMFRSHDLFRDYDWGLLERGGVKPPYQPSLNSDFDTRYFDDFPDSEHEISNFFTN